MSNQHKWLLCYKDAVHIHIRVMVGLQITGPKESQYKHKEKEKKHKETRNDCKEMLNNQKEMKYLKADNEHPK